MTGVARMYQELSGSVAGGVRMFQDLSGHTRSCQHLSGVVRSFKDEPKVVKSARVVRSWSVLEKMQLSLSLS